MFRDHMVPFDHELSVSELHTDSTSLTRQNDDNNLDDIWGSAPASPASENFSLDRNHAVTEPSDVPRLRSEHSTSGYRDGLSSAKNTTIQGGFDEGYSLGAVMGLEVGILLGLLEGIRNALHSAGDIYSSEKQRTDSLIENVRRELRTEEVFGRDWWNEDGTWDYEIPGESAGETADFTFREVAESHPLIKKWKVIVKMEVERWKLDLTTTDRAEEKRMDSKDER